MLLSAPATAVTRGSLALVIGIAAMSVAQAAQAPAAMRFAWDRAYGNDANWSELRAIAPTGTGEVYVAVSERDGLDPRTATATRLLLWTISADGELTREVEIKTAASGKTATTASIRDVTPLAGGEALLLVDVEGGRPALVRVNRAGAQTLTKELLPAGRFVTLSDIVPVATDRFVIIGHESLNALQVGVDPAGNILWEKTEDRGRMDFYVDGVALPDGGHVLVGNSGEYDAVRSGASTIWIARYDAKGEMKGDVSFPGRFGRITRGADGAFGIVYDRSGSNDQHITAKGLTADLKDSWTRELLKIGPNFSDFKITAIASGGFLIAGGDRGKPYVALLAADGRENGLLRGEAVERSLDLGSYGLGADRAAAFVAASHVDARDKATVRQKVRIRKVAL